MEGMTPTSIISLLKFAKRTHRQSVSLATEAVKEVVAGKEQDRVLLAQ
jgi:hypothetical protein